MRDGNCNDIPGGAYVRAFNRHHSEVAQAENIVEAAGIIYRCAREAEAPKPIAREVSCTSCFNDIEALFHRAGLFEGQKLPPRTFGDDCERRRQCAGPACAVKCG